MTITQIILASLNIIAAGVMLWFASQAAYARHAWTATLRYYEQQRDGDSTADWLASLNPQQLQTLRGRIVIDDAVIAGLKPDERKRIHDALLSDSGSKSDAAVRHEIAKLFWNTGQHAEYEKGADGKLTLKNVTDDKEPNPPTKLIQGDDLKKLADALGPAGFTSLIRQAIQQQHPRLALGEREAVNKVYDARRRLADLNGQIAKVQSEVQLLTERRDVEKALLAQAQQENLERRREITRLQADVEEALGAYTMALGRESDKKRQLEELLKQINKTIEDINRLDAEIGK
jgi:hypothetical protein